MSVHCLLMLRARLFGRCQGLCVLTVLPRSSVRRGSLGISHCIYEFGRFSSSASFYILL